MGRTRGTRSERMACLGCAYELAGLPAGPCPECGRPFDPRHPLSFESRQHRERVLRVLERTTLWMASAPWAAAGAIHLSPVLWLVEFGRWPSLATGDDPKAMALGGPVWMVVLVGGAGTLAVLPVAAGLIGLVAAKGGWRALRGGAVFVAIWGAGVWVLLVDPLRVGLWWFD